jgi:hypothetical protein
MSLKAVVLPLVFALALVGICFFSRSRQLDTFAFFPGDLAFSFAHRVGLVAFIFGRNSEGTHHIFQVLFSLLCWWLAFVLSFSATRHIYRRINA